MAALRRRKIVATLLKLTRRARPSSPPTTGPGCTCDSCVQAWDRHQPADAASLRNPARRWRPGLD
jgi:hypothetical protein